MGSLHLQLPVTEDKTSIADNQFNILVQYLEGPERAAQRITASINGPATPDNPASDENLAVAVVNLWDLMISTAIQIPYDHPWQDRQVISVEWITRLPPPSRPDLQGLLDNVDVLIGLWDNMALLTNTIDDNFIEKGLAGEHHRSHPNPFSKNEWTNFCAFVVRLWERRLIGDGKLNGAEELLRSILDQERPVWDLNNNLSAAGVWILYGGGETYRRSVNGMEPFSLERWNAWKARFQVLREDQSLHSNSRDWADGSD